MGANNYTFEDIFGSMGKPVDDMVRRNEPDMDEKLKEYFEDCMGDPFGCKRGTEKSSCKDSASEKRNQQIQKEAESVIQFIKSDLDPYFNIETERVKLAKVMTGSIQGIQSITKSLSSSILQMDPSKDTSREFLKQLIGVVDSYEKQYIDLLARTGIALAKSAESIQKNEALIMENPTGLGELISYLGRCMDLYKNTMDNIIKSLDAVRLQDNANRFAIAIGDRMTEISEQMEENEKNNEQSTD